MTDVKQDPLMMDIEKPICVQLAAGEPPTSQRAQALLTLDAGATVEEAADQSGLTPNQVIYWRGRFRTRRLGVFPDDLVAAARQAGIEATVVDALVKEDDAADADSATPKSVAKKKKSKKDKGAKKKSGKKKAKKDDKAKKKKGKKKDSKKKGKKSKKK